MTRTLLSLLVLCVCPFGVRAADRPNIVFFFADDQTSSALGCYGNEIAQTPNIDALAAKGVRFDNAFVSHSICWVSRTTILTGLVGRSYGTPGNRELAKPSAVASLVSDLLHNYGYRTGFFGKWHAKMPPGFEREDHFDEFEAIGRNPFYKRQPDGSLRHETELIVDRGIEFLQQQPAGRPFALNLWFNACHAEDSDRRPGIGHFAWPRAVDEMYADIEFPTPHLNDPVVFDALPDFLKTTINRERYFWRWNTPQKYQQNMQAYYRMVSGIDGAIGRFLDALQASGHAENTIIVYSADNGYHMANRGLAGKWTHFEESLRVPLIVFDPRSPAAGRGQVADGMVLNLDLPATFVDWASDRVPSHYQGRSLRPWVEGDSPEDWRQETFHEHFAVRHRIPAFEGVRTEQYKYVRYVDHDFEFLHDLQQDPDELVNLANDPDHRNTLEEFRRRTDQRVEMVGGALAPPQKEFQSSTVAHPLASAAVTVKPSADGRVRLLGGKNLNGWSGDRALWSFDEGTVTGSTDGSLTMNRFLTWKGSTIRNFDLRAQVKISAQGNSGIQYRSALRPDLGLDVVSGYQCDIVADGADFNGMMYEEKGRRILGYAGQKVIVDPEGKTWILEQFPQRDFPAEQWHEYRIRVSGNHHQHWIDGHPTAEMLDFDANGRALEGVLAFQLHRGRPMTVQFRDVTIEHLPDDLPLQQFVDHPIPVGSEGVRPQGKLPPDWKPPRYQQDPGKSD